MMINIQNTGLRRALIRKFILYNGLVFCFLSVPVSYGSTLNFTAGDHFEGISSLQLIQTVTGDYTHAETAGYFGESTKRAIGELPQLADLVTPGTNDLAAYKNTGPQKYFSFATHLPDTVNKSTANNNEKKKRTISIAKSPSPLPVTSNIITVTGPEVVVTTERIPTIFVPWGNKTRRFIDAAVTTFTNNGVRYWYLSHPLRQIKFEGTLDNPFKKEVWRKVSQPGAKNEFFTNQSDYPKNYFWISDIYQTTKGILAFIHTETPPPPTPTSKYTHGKVRIGLAWSTDGGNSYRYLGHIVQPHGDVIRNLQGAPYIVKDDYFYVYHKDNASQPSPSNDCIARAKVSDVLDGAARGTTTEWKRYYRSAWDSPGLGGKCTGVNLSPAGINNAAMAHSNYNDKYYAVMTRKKRFTANNKTVTCNGDNTCVNLYESDDALHWRFVKTVAEQKATDVLEGYQYVSIIDQSGSDNSKVGQKFYIYCGYNPAISNKPELHRWLIDLSGRSDNSTISPDISTNKQGDTNWHYPHKAHVRPMNVDLLERDNYSPHS